ncbi:MAG: selenocysteine-specific translation elongation factor [Desulfuromonadaceae bacterium]|nr:selenocysteine-specific translation elongation factor [Desulfuromonadaceae bacterium]MDD2855369.1 selenocysteine-specific translation elongation factor [Desulfuromonadaceae bacterium]
MKNLILGTAGHIDHGKTSLVKALTGVDTDRLPEEKSRGITIELGFAGLDLPDGIHFGIVDVPGHERFVRTMVAGVGGMDLVMMVIAADEGVMPQTREHLDICQLLGVKRGVVALTKSDLVDPEWLSLVVEEVREFLADSFLEEAPIIPVSSRSGSGIDRLRDELAVIAGELEQKRSEGPYRLPIDRVFTLSGFGTVVTGTLLSGSVSLGDEAELLPSALPCRIRGIQAHGAKVETGDAGSRLALNLQGVDHYQVRRGDVVVPKGVYQTTRIVDVYMNHLASAPRSLKHRSGLRLHSATYEVPATVILFDRPSLAPGESAYAQLRLARPVLLLNGDPFVLRTSSPSATVAGGRILDPSPPGRRRRSAEALKLLGSLSAGIESSIISGMVSGSMLSGITHDEISARSGIPSRRLEAALSVLLTAGKIVQVVREPKKYLSRESFTLLCDLLLEVMNSYFVQNPLKEGISKEELKSRIPARSDSRFFTPCLAALEKSGRVIAERELVRLAGRKAGSETEQVDVRDRIKEELDRGGKEPPFVNELCKLLNIPEKQAAEHLALLAAEGEAIRLKSDIFYRPEPLLQIEEILTAYLREKGEINPAEFREISGLSRKFMIPLLEYFDSRKVTIRLGDKRVLRRK